MPGASDNGSQPYSCPHRGCEMAGMSDTHTLNLAIGKGHTQTMSPTQGQAILLGQPFPSHFETPKGVSVWLATFV